MTNKITKSSFTVLLSACLLVLMLAACRRAADPAPHTTIQHLPLVRLHGDAVDIAQYYYLGSWLIPDAEGRTRRYAWRDAVRLEFEGRDGDLKIVTNENKLQGSTSMPLTPDAESVVFDKIEWKNNQVSVFAFRCQAPQKRVVVIEIDTDNSLALYVNGKLAREMSGADNAEVGAKLLIPASLEAGENVCVVKVFSNAGPPRLRMAMTLDQSKDFQAACGTNSGFLVKQILSRDGNSFEPPVVKWDSLLSRMTLGVDIYDVLSGTLLMKKESLRSGNIIRSGGFVLGEGVYKAIFRSDQASQEIVEEYFLVGSPKKVLVAITGALDELSWGIDEKLNVEAQLRRAEILFRKSNYDVQNKQWQEKVLFTLGSLAKYVSMKKNSSGNVFKGMLGLQLRGFISHIDNSKQFYRLFVPSNHLETERVPLVIIMPTTLQSVERSFLESPLVASHQKALQICRYAEKYGFAVLWPGYRSAPFGWTYEAAHVVEALENVEKNYNIDCSKICLYGICAGGFYAGRLASIYPKRFSAIAYDRVIFDRAMESLRGLPDSIKEWFRTINPSEMIIANQNLAILVLNDGTRIAGHGEMKLTRQFLDKALKKRTDIKYVLGQRAMGNGLWDSIFKFFGECKNEHPSPVKADVPAVCGYAGPISEVFATPFIVVEGTVGLNREGAYFMELVIKNLKRQYQAQFYGAEFVLKKDAEITDEDLKNYSLVLVGNAESNAVWRKLLAGYPDSMTPYNPPDDWSSFSTRKDAFAEVFRNPVNKNNYLLLIGSSKLKNMALLEKFDPSKAWFDCYIHSSLGDYQRERIFTRRP